MKKLPIVAASIFIAATLVNAADSPVSSTSTGHLLIDGAVARYTFDPATSKASVVDFQNATPMPTPAIPYSVKTVTQNDVSGLPGFSPGEQGDGVIQPMYLGKSSLISNASSALKGAIPMDFGSKGVPFSTARADLFGLSTNTTYPYRASGKLFFNADGGTFVCSASLIKPGIIVTAAHCVTEYGTGQFNSGFSFVPGYRDGWAPFGTWTAVEVRVMEDYLNGKGCSHKGVVCKDDIAIIVLSPQSAPTYPGINTGWYGYGWDGAGFAGKKTQITQIGYPVCLDNGELMQRNDSFGVRKANLRNNTTIGSLMCGGSSGGPWLVNFGETPVLTGTTTGLFPYANMVVGVSSWGFLDDKKLMGASTFTSNNIQLLVDSACNVHPDACQQ